MTEGTEGRGRPRPKDTIDRDEKVYATLKEKGPLTRTQVAEAIGTTPSIAYMSLFRLRKAGEVERQPGAGEGRRSHTWVALDKKQ